MDHVSSDPTSFLAPLQVLTCVVYLYFTAQCVSAYRETKSKTSAATAFLALAVVFALCSLTGYLLPFIENAIGYRPGWMLWGHIALHSALPIATVFLIQQGAARNIMKALTNGVE